jgi:hypothetical protein
MTKIQRGGAGCNVASSANDKDVGASPKKKARVTSKIDETDPIAGEQFKQFRRWSGLRRSKGPDGRQIGPGDPTWESPAPIHNLPGIDIFEHPPIEPGVINPNGPPSLDIHTEWRAFLHACG